MIARDDGQVGIYDPADLKLQQEFRPAAGNAPRFARTSSDGRWIAVLFHNGRLWMYDTRDNRGLHPAVSGQGDISAADFDGSDRLLIADRGTRLTTWKLDPLVREQVDAPQLATVEWIYYYGIRPIYTLFPKPGELNNVVTWLLTDQESVPVGGPPGSQNLQQTRVKLDVWGPLWSSALFTVIVLGLTCVYVSRKDF